MTDEVMAITLRATFYLNIGLPQYTILLSKLELPVLEVSPFLGQS